MKENGVFHDRRSRLGLVYLYLRSKYDSYAKASHGRQREAKTLKFTPLHLLQRVPIRDAVPDCLFMAPLLDKRSLRFVVVFMSPGPAYFNITHHWIKAEN